VTRCPLTSEDFSATEWIAGVKLLAQPQGAFAKWRRELDRMTIVDEDCVLVGNMAAVMDAAAETLDHDVLQWALQEWNAALDGTGSARYFEAALARATAANRYDVVAVLAKARPSLLPWAERAMVAAIRTDSEDGVSRLASAKVSLSGAAGRSAAYEAAAQGSTVVLKLLLLSGGAGTWSRAPATEKDSLLAVAAAGGHVEAVRAVLESRAATSDEEEEGGAAFSSAEGAATSPAEGAAAIFAAACRGHAACVRALHEAKAPVGTARPDGCTPLMAASYQGFEAAARELLACKADARARTRDGTSALFAAALSGHVGCVAALLEAKAVPYAREDGWTPRTAAQHRGHAAVVLLLLNDDEPAARAMSAAEKQVIGPQKVADEGDDAQALERQVRAARTASSPGEMRDFLQTPDLKEEAVQAALQHAVKRGAEADVVRLLLEAKAAASPALMRTAAASIYCGPLAALAAADEGARADLLRTAVRFGRAAAVRTLLGQGGCADLSATQCAQQCTDPETAAPAVTQLLLGALRRGQKHARWHRDVRGVVTALLQGKADLGHAGGEMLEAATTCPGLSDSECAGLVDALHKGARPLGPEACYSGALHAALQRGSAQTALRILRHGKWPDLLCGGIGVLEAVRALPPWQAAATIRAVAAQGVDFGDVHVSDAAQTWTDAQPLSALVDAKADVRGCLASTDDADAALRLVRAKAAVQRDLDAMLLRLAGDGQEEHGRLLRLVQAKSMDDGRHASVYLRNLLREAATLGNLAAVQRLAQSTEDLTVEARAALPDDPVAVRTLLAAKASAATLAAGAARRDDLGSLECLLACKADPATFENPSTLLLEMLAELQPATDWQPHVVQAVKHGRLHAVRSLLRIKADVGKVADAAISFRSQAVVDLLVRSKADVADRLPRAPPPVRTLAQSWRAPSASSWDQDRVLLPAQGPSDARRLGAWTSRDDTAVQQEPAGCGRMAQHEPAAHASTGHDGAPRKRRSAGRPDPRRLLAAIRTNNKTAAARLVAAGTDAGFALCQTLRETDVEVCMRQLTVLRQAGVDVGVGFFLMAARTGNVPAIDHFVRAGIDVAASIVDGQTALHYAVMHRHVMVASRLLAAKADPQVADAYGRTPARMGAGFVHSLVQG
jgi:ankyrin repeat protein